MTFSNKHIVAIDDTHSILTFLRISLESLGATFHGAVTAAGGLALCEKENPDLVVLDIGLPDKEGLDILHQIKRIDKTRNLPVIVLTVRKEQESRDLATQLGADAYVTKPFIMDDLIEVIHTQLKKAGNMKFGSAGNDNRKIPDPTPAPPSGSRYPVQ